MLLQTNSYVVPREKRAEHARMVRKFRQTLGRLGCDQFDVFEQVGANWFTGETTGRFVQMMRFRDRKHQLAVQAAEKQDPAAQALIAEFCELINFPYQQQQGLFAVGFYQSVLPVAPMRALPSVYEEGAGEVDDVESTPIEGEAIEVESVELDPVKPEEGETSDEDRGLRMVEGQAVDDEIDIAEIEATDASDRGNRRPPQG